MIHALWTLAGIAMVTVLSTGCTDQPDGSGFAGLAESAPASAFRQPEPGDRIVLPDDWGAHPQHRIEWWYLTANLETAGGEPLGIQWTQFRQGLEPRPPEESPPPASQWPLASAWMAHGAVSFNGQHWFSERFARGDIGQAGARAEPLAVWLDHWQLEADGPDRWRLSASGADWSYRLTLQPGGAIIRHGDNGFSAKSADGFGSMYFSLTDIAINGTVTLEGTDYSVSGTGWLDREWSSQFLRSDQQGWDWFALRLDDGARLMVFRVGRGDDAYLASTWIGPEGGAHALSADQIQLVPSSWRSTEQGRVPVTWRLRIPARGVNLTIKAPEGVYWNQGLYAYWESPVIVTGSHAGEGYMELTGYYVP